MMAAVLKNAAKERLDAGQLALGVILRQARTVDIAPIMKSCGYDWLFLDLEHNSMDLDIAVQIAVAALGAGIARWRGCRPGSCGWRPAFSTVAGSASSCRMSTRPRRRSGLPRRCATRRWATARS